MLDEPAVDARVVVQFGMEGGGEHVALAGGDDVAVYRGQHFYVRSGYLVMGTSSIPAKVPRVKKLPSCRP